MRTYIHGISEPNFNTHQVYNVLIQKKDKVCVQGQIPNILTETQSPYKSCDPGYLLCVKYCNWTTYCIKKAPLLYGTKVR